MSDKTHEVTQVGMSNSGSAFRIEIAWLVAVATPVATWVALA